MFYFTRDRSLTVFFLDESARLVSANYRRRLDTGTGGFGCVEAHSRRAINPNSVLTAALRRDTPRARCEINQRRL